MTLVSLRAQTTGLDSTFLKEYPFQIGKVGFAIDSMEYIVGDVNSGTAFEHRIGMYNFGSKPIRFTGGKISRFTEMRYEPTTLQPNQSGEAVVSFEAVRDLPLGSIHIEVAIESDDKDSRFKFLYLIANIVIDSSRFQKSLIIDTVPRIVFAQLNYDFGYLWRGKPVIHDFFFTNMGSQELVIEDIYSSDGCVIIGKPNDVIPPGENGSVVIKVRNWDSYGVQHQTVTIASNDPVNPLITLGLHGTVRQHAPAKLRPDFCYE